MAVLMIHRGHSYDEIRMVPCLGTEVSLLDVDVGEMLESFERGSFLGASGQLENKEEVADILGHRDFVVNAGERLDLLLPLPLAAGLILEAQS